MESVESKRRPPVHAVPLKTPTAEKVKGALGELPAYVQRARRTEDAVAAAFREASRTREEMLSFVCLRLRQYLDSVPGPDPIHPTVRKIHEAVRELSTFKELRSRPARRSASRVALGRLGASVARFNRRFRRFIEEDAPLDRANREIDGFNRYYPLERQAAIRHVPLDKLTLEAKTPLTREDLIRELPLLPELT